MTGFEPLVAAATAGLTALVTDTIKSQGSNVLTRFLSQDISKGIKQACFDASRKYIQNYVERHGNLKVLGMREPVSLDSVYTTVQILDSADCRFTSVKDLEQAFRATQKDQSQFGSRLREDGLEIANEEQYLMVLGAPGCGKSTFLRKIGLEALKGNRGALKEYRCIPVLLELKRFTEPKADIKKLIATEFQICGFPNAERFTQNALEQGKLLILLDGLDEVPTASRDAVIETIEDFVDQHDKNRYITSCRTAAYRHNFRRFTDVTIAEFNNDQIRQFISNWFQSQEDKQSGTAERCWTVLQQPENAAAKELAHTPLLLTFLCLVYNRSQTFSNNRSTLYRKALRILLEEWAAEKRILYQEIYQGLNTELEEVLLSEIAASSFDSDRLFLYQTELVDQIKTFLASNLNAPKHLSGEAVLNAIAVQQGILVERAEDIYSFSHLTLQEYLTAQYIVNHRRIEPLVTEHISDRRWHEVFLLVSGLMVIGSGADELLQTMSRIIQTYAAVNPKLQLLLQWIYGVTARAIDSQQGAAKRAAVLVLTLDLDLVGPELNHNRARKRDFDLTRELARNLARDLARDLAIDCARDLTKALAHALDLVRTRARDLNITYGRELAFDQKKDFERVSTLNHELEHARILSRKLSSLFVGIDCALLENQLASLQSTLPDFGALITEHHKFADRLRQLYTSIFKLDPTLLDLTADEQKTIESYLYMNRLMVQCQQEASRVSPQVWESNLATILTPASTVVT